MSLLVLILGLFLALALLWGAKKLLKRERLVLWGRSLFCGLSWIIGAGLFAAVFYLAVRFFPSPGVVFVIFLVLFFVSKEKKGVSDPSTDIVEYNPIKTFKKPILFFSTIGLYISGGLLLLMFLLRGNV